MKKLSQIMLVAFIMLAGTYTTRAQVSLSVRIGSPPVWAPAAYAHTTRYYYIPEIDSYYDAQNHGYYYNDGPNWVFSASLPGIYAHYNIGSLHHVRVNYFGERPYTYFNNSRSAYIQRYHPVQYHDVRYRQVEYGHYDNGNHGGRGNEWHGDNGHGPDKGRGPDRGDNRGHDDHGGDRGHGGDDHGHH